MLWKSSISRSLPSLELPLAFPLQDGRCLSCHFRRAGYQVIARRYNGNRNGVKDAVTSSKPSTEASGHPQDTESGSGSPKEEGEFTPLVLDRPIGLIYPPQEGQNTGIDTRSIKERRDDFVDYQKHVQRRKEL
jgi:ATPase complex subunit ATP10